MMKVIASVAVSTDGCMDDCTPQRLVLSCEEDWRAVHALRAACDAILVGAETVRRDNPALMIRDEALREQRRAAGMSPDLVKVVVTRSGRLDAGLRFFTEGDGVRKIVIASAEADREALRRLEPVAQVIVLPWVTARGILDALEAEGVRSVLVEGGAQIMRMFLDEDAVDRLRLAVAPMVVGDEAAPHMPYFGGCFPFADRASERVERVGNMEVHHYEVLRRRLSDEDRRLIERAVLLGERSEPCATAYRVGCVLKTADGQLFEGYTHETDPKNHAEEEAIAKAEQAGVSLVGATIYTSMEPCSTRASKPVSCSEWIIRHRMARVVYAYAEPECFVRCEGTQRLREAGIEVTVAPEYAARVIEVNAHIIGKA